MTINVTNIILFVILLYKALTNFHPSYYNGSKRDSFLSSIIPLLSIFYSDYSK